MKSIKNYILQQVAKNALSQEQAKQLLLELNQASTSANANDNNDVAIVGMAGRFPKAENAEEFWQLLRDGVNCIDDYPQGRKDDFEHILRNPYYTEFLTGDAMREEDIPHAHARAGYLHQIDKFDADFFGIPPSEATFMDPYQRIALETAWETMEDAGYGDKTLFGTNTGIYIGKENTNYSLYRYCSAKDPMQLTGSWESIMASRISYLFNFRGPCMVIDTACSAGLVSVHMAVKALQNGECETAIAGGINLSVTGEFNTRFQGGMNMDSVESDDGVIRTFDANADGTVWGEGVALVMLKPLKRALKDGDHIHAVIKGSAINNDGASNGLTAPNAEAQEDVVVKAWENAGISPESLQYIEAHGTGTVLGDPIEFKGLTASFRKFTQRKQFCAIGSLKTNMGHLVAASGCASLFKVIKQIQNKQMAPTINFEEPNPYIPFQNSPLYVNDILRDWPENDGPRRAALSSFGFSHTNCHMVIEEAAELPPAEAKRPRYCLTISTKKLGQLAEYVTRYQRRCEATDWSLADLCFTANTGRGHYAHRLAIVAESENELRENLHLALALVEEANPREIEGKVYFASHQLVSDKKTQRNTGDISAKEKTELSQKAGAALAKYVAQGNASDLIELAFLYCSGADIAWREFYSAEKRRRLALPTYPFERVRRWADPKISKIMDYTARLHPLVDKQLSASESYWLYQSLFSATSHWVLSDHRIQNTCVVPGTTYLEMARFAASHAMGWNQLELAKIFFLQPLIVEENESRLVNIHLTKEADELRFVIESRMQESKDDAWQKHVEGIARVTNTTTKEVPTHDHLKATAIETIEHYIGEADTGVFQFGPHWDCVRSAWSLPQTTLAKLALPEHLQTELEKFLIHPSMLDNAMNLTSQISGDTYLPFMYKSFKYYASFTQGMHSHIIPIGATNGETNTYDVILTDASGRVLAEIEGYVTKRVHSLDFSEAQKNNCLSLHWLPTELKTAKNPTRLWVLGEASSAMHEYWQQAGIEVVEKQLEIISADAVLALFNEGDTPDAIVVLDRLLSNASSMTDACEANSLHRFFHLAKAIQSQKVKLSSGLVLVTEQSFCLNQEEKSLNPYGAASTMLAIALGQESSDLDVRVIDTDSLDDCVAKNLFCIPSGKLHLCRKREFYAAELYARPLLPTKQTALKDNGVYFITGGLGGLGLSTAEYIANTVEAHVVLCGRSPLAKPQDWESLAETSAESETKALYKTLCTLRNKLKSLIYVSMDVADAASVRVNLQRIENDIAPISGIFHTAGVAGDGFILRKEFTTFENVLTAKTRGTMNLLNNITIESLDFCILFSSITALTAGEGQGDYAAANAFMDAVATQHTNVHAINWSSWSDVGMAAAFGVDDAVSPFEVIPPAVAYSRMESLIEQPLQGNAIPADINPKVLVNVIDKLPFRFEQSLEVRILQMSSDQHTSTINIDEIDITGKSPEELTETEKTLAKIYASILGLNEIDIFTNFQDMGGNSIIATHLLKVVEEYYPGQVDISDIFSYPAIDVMAEYIDEKNGVAVTQEQPDSLDWEKMLDDVESGSESIDTLLGKV
ncbi:beta-ketoacyl synthase N-terminal-like domain-containing protein [Saccharophagus degradans]|uniref:beta-ketoacyl synthase N-terminal-like domain-containing protein n=1 Tax=Saccharophagus degradans TaxID=86304 RepID=UPI002478246D|nr:beta-ketoacyl synthase N-terminal-like domain-containing protein [Saccharophagus degradans]WGO96538.1 beta-ketoacyl synthase N-terminal-like domain-containing protein [Saccharophagus degradans]